MMHRILKVVSKIWLIVIVAMFGTAAVSVQANELEPYQGIFYNGSDFVSIALYTYHNPEDVYYREGIAYLVEQPYWGDYGTLQMDIIQSLGDIVLQNGKHVFWENADLNSVEFYSGKIYINGNSLSGEFVQVSNSGANMSPGDIWFQMPSSSSSSSSSGSNSNASSGNGSGKVSNSDIVKATTSSYLSEPEWGLYHTADCIIDGDVTLAWTEDVPGQGIGEWVQFDFSGSKEVSGFDIWAGHHYSKDLYEKNSRPKTIRVYTEKGYKDFNLQDSFKSQRIDFGKPVKTSYVKIEVKSVYEGWKYDDTCISEISFY